MTWTLPALQLRFKKILTDHGQNVYLRRRCTYCAQDAPFADYDDDCTYCHGKGYIQTLEHYTMRKMIIGAQWSFTRSAQMTEVGIKLDEGVYFFCEAVVKPKVGDLIYDWNDATEMWETYEIEKALEREAFGEVLFYTCAGEIREDIKHL